MIKFSKIKNFFKSPPIVSVLRLSGVIGKGGIGRGGLTLEGLNDSIEKAFAHSKLAAVCLSINSPGGSPVQSELIASRIIELAKKKKVPVYGFVEDVAASGGYWLACAADEIYASKSSIVGSIGVISSGFGLQDLIKKIGVERRVVTQGKNKSVLDPFMPAKKEDIEIISGLQKEIHEHFIDHIKTRRGKKLKETDEKLFNGEFWAGHRALEYGLIDGLDTMHHFLKKKFGDNMKIEYVKAKESMLKRLLARGMSSDDIVDSLCEKYEQELVGSRFRVY